MRAAGSHRAFSRRSNAAAVVSREGCGAYLSYPGSTLGGIKTGGAEYGAISSAGVFNSDDKLVRTLWTAHKNYPAVNQPDVAWDGTLDDGSVAPSGTYEIKVLSHDCRYSWDGVIANITDAGEIIGAHPTAKNFPSPVG